MRFSTFDDLNAEAVAQLLARRRVLFARTRDLSGIVAAGQCIRIHGDYHLGQTLRTGGHAHGTEEDDFVILDFEGEPARPLADRRRKQSPLKDVAGMVRSFSYAAHSALGQFLSASSDESPTAASEQLKSWTASWERSVTSEFLRAYLQTIAAKPDLLPPTEQSQLLLNAYLLEKALYEVMYELNNRPTWLRIPVAGILGL
jgi:maltose alpha-D-glucosyltransferase / alpha-amylase